MNHARLKDIAEFVGITAIVASLIFVGLQMRQTQDIALNEMRYNQVDRKIEADGLTYEYANIWVRGNAGDKLDHADAVIYDGLVDAKWVNAFWTSLTLRQLGRSYKRSLHDFAWFLNRNPGARKSWESGVSERRQYLELLQTGAEAEADEFVIEIQDSVFADLKRLDELAAQERPDTPKSGDANSATEISAITAQLEAIYDLSKTTGTVEALTSNQLWFFSDQPTVQPPNQAAIVGREAVTKFYRDIFETGINFLENSFADLAIDVQGNLATRRYIGTAVFQTADSSETQSVTNMYLDVLIDVNGEWKTLLHSWVPVSID